MKFEYVCPKCNNRFASVANAIREHVECPFCQQVMNASNIDTVLMTVLLMEDINRIEGIRLLNVLSKRALSKRALFKHVLFKLTKCNQSQQLLQYRSRGSNLLHMRMLRNSELKLIVSNLIQFFLTLSIKNPYRTRFSQFLLMKPQTLSQRIILCR